MKLFIGFLAVLVGVVLAEGYLIELTTKTRLEIMAQNAFENGCLNGSQRICGHIRDDIKRSGCQELALEKCPSDAVNFRKWLRSLRK